MAFSDNNAKVTVSQLSTVATAITEQSDARFVKPADLGDLAAKDEVVKTDLGSALQAEITGKADAATSLSGYGITDAYTKTEVDAKISSVYKAKGTLASSGLTNSLLVAANEGNVYNISDGFTTTADFVEGTGKTHGAGANVAIVEATPADNSDPQNPVAATYKFDVLPGFVDLSNYATNSDVAIATTADITSIVNGLYGGSGSSTVESGSGGE